MQLPTSFSLFYTALNLNTQHNIQESIIKYSIFFKKYNNHLNALIKKISLHFELKSL